MHNVLGRVSEEVANREGELPAAGGQRAVELLQGRRLPRRERFGRVVLGARLERPQRARPRAQEPRARARTLPRAAAAACLVRSFEHMLSARLACFCAQEDVSDPVELLGYYHASSTNEELVQKLKEGEPQVQCFELLSRFHSRCSRVQLAAARSYCARVRAAPRPPLPIRRPLRLRCCTCTHSSCSATRRCTSFASNASLTTHFDSLESHMRGPRCIRTLVYAIILKVSLLTVDSYYTFDSIMSSDHLLCHVLSVDDL